MTLHEEIAQNSLAAAFDTLNFSVGEVVALYREGDIALPENWEERFTWSTERKSALIESLLVGIPVSDIYLAVQEDGTWELVDGVQRIATILEFMGHLPGPGGHDRSPLALTGTDLLPSLEGMVWASEEPDAKVLPTRLRFEFRRPKIGAHVLHRGAAPDVRQYLDRIVHGDREPASLEPCFRP